MKQIIIVVLSVLLAGCSGVNVNVPGNNNTVEVKIDREGGATVTTTPNVQWGNLGK